MPRIDARAKTGLTARAIFRGTDKAQEEKVTIRELSLSGALVEALPGVEGDACTLRTRLPDIGEIELPGDVVRKNGRTTALRLFCSDPKTKTALWDYIRPRLSGNGSCPYCGCGTHHDRYCRRCGHYLEFDDSIYLDKHLRRSFSARVEARLEKLRSDSLERVISYIDTELLKVRGKSPEEEFVGTCPQMMRVFSMIGKVAPTDMNVLILGESGTGKELTAKAIHERSDRSEKPFIPFNCAAIPEGLLEAELFGYQRGAFTGAYTTKKGKFELADGGTIFLDEIGDLSPALQAKLLRFLEDHIVERIGGKGGHKVDVRIIAATNCDINNRLEKQLFREDLFFRLNAFAINLPPLRERGEDKVVLARFFFQRLARNNTTFLQGFSDQALQAIRHHDWPGNVREMINRVRRAMVMATGELIEPQDMELEAVQHRELASYRKEVSKTKREVILAALEDNNYVIARTARTLGISRPGLYNLMKKFGIQY